MSSGCSCLLGPGQWGASGWHYYRASASHCWLSGSVSQTTEEDGEKVRSCTGGCQSRRQLQGGEAINRPETSRCIYRGKPMAFERCAPYWAAVRIVRPDGSIVTFKIDPEDKKRLLKSSKSHHYHDDRELLKA